MIRRPVTRYGLASASLAVMLMVTACANGGPAEPAPAAPAPAPAPAPDGPAQFVIVHSLLGEEERAGLRELIAAFNERHPDVQVRDEATSDVAAAVTTALADGSLPDLAIVADPRVLEMLVRNGVAKPLDDVIDVVQLASRTVPGLVDLANFGGRVFAVPLRVDLKSLVWYSPKHFEARQYTIPTTWDALITLSDRMVGDGRTPWCIGIESGPATGWVLTDWVEDVLLRAIGVDAYDRWAAGELPFAGTEVEAAIGRYLAPILTDAYVHGGRASIATEPYTTSALGILGDDPVCGLHRQAFLIREVFADDAPSATFGVDYDFFFLPGLTADDRPVLGTADVVVLTSENPAAELFLEFLTLPGSGERWAARGGFLSPFAADFDIAVLPDEASRRATSVLAAATAFRFDGSDRFPPAVGASDLPGSFWTEMTRWASGRTSLEDALEAIDARYAQVTAAR